MPRPQACRVSQAAQASSYSFLLHCYGLTVSPLNSQVLTWVCSVFLLSLLLIPLTARCAFQGRIFEISFSPFLLASCGNPPKIPLVLMLGKLPHGLQETGTESVPPTFPQPLTMHGWICILCHCAVQPQCLARCYDTAGSWNKERLKM